MFANEQVLVAEWGGQVGIAALRQVDAVDQVEFGQAFERAVNGDETDSGVPNTSEIEDLGRVEGALAMGDNLDDGTARGGNAVAAVM